MPLSEHEQRLFEQIERSLAEDPKFASRLRANDPRFHARRRIFAAVVLFAGGIALLIYGVVSKLPLLGVVGFVVMFGSAWFAMQSYRRGQSGGDLRSTSSRRPRSTGRRGGSVVDRLEERWRRRPEGDL